MGNGVVVHCSLRYTLLLRSSQQWVARRRDPLNHFGVEPVVWFSDRCVIAHTHPEHAG